MLLIIEPWYWYVFFQSSTIGPIGSYISTCRLRCVRCPLDSRHHLLLLLHYPARVWHAHIPGKSWELKPWIPGLKCSIWWKIDGGKNGNHSCWKWQSINGTFQRSWRPDAVVCQDVTGLTYSKYYNQSMQRLSDRTIKHNVKIRCPWWRLKAGIPISMSIGWVSIVSMETLETLFLRAGFTVNQYWSYV